ncbi:MAG: acyltransferase [Muribaculaceae bacterium]|nr:acyltransferase [Muribaculaceae bacterium]
MGNTAESNNIQSKSNSFLKFIAYLQILGIILVVFGHSFHEHPQVKAGHTLLIWNLFTNFRMPLFMFVSGFLMIYTTFKRSNTYPTPAVFIKKKAKRLLIPYIVLTVITYMPRALLPNYAHDQVPSSIKGPLQSLYITEYLPIGYFWFIQSSFLLLVIIYSIIYISRRKNIPPEAFYLGILIIFIFTLFLDMPDREYFGINSMRELGFYFLFGAVYCEYYDKINRILPLDTMPSFIISFALWLTLFFVADGSWIILKFASLFGIAMCINVAKLMVKHNVRILDHLTGANYIIFLLSWYFNTATQQILSHYVTLPWWVHTILSLICGIYIPWLFYKCTINSHNKAVRAILFLLGQKPK